MEVMSLAALAVVCGAVAIYLWMSVAKLQTQLDGFRARADKAEAEAGKATDRADALRKKLEKTGDSNAYEERSLKEARARASEAKEELQKTRAALKRAEQQTEELALKMRKADSQIEELQVMAQVRRPQAAAPVVVQPAPEPVQAAAPAPTEPRPDDPQLLLRRAELDAEREQRELERQKMKQERDAQRAQSEEQRLREVCDQLAQERNRWRQEALGRELELRITFRKAEHNRRAYVMTMGALDLAEDELYRIKHGTERPEFTPNRAAGFAPDLEAERNAGTQAEDRLDDVEAAEQSRENAAQDQAPEAVVLAEAQVVTVTAEAAETRAPIDVLVDAHPAEAAPAIASDAGHGAADPSVAADA